MELLTIVLKGLCGGLIVVIFSAMGELIRPRGLSGITSGAPSVALASLAVSLVASGVTVALNLSLGMIAGAAALVLWCLIGVESVKRLGALKGSVLTTGIWLIAALSLWAVFLQ
jgi:hypothetical protein